MWRPEGNLLFLLHGVSTCKHFLTDYRFAAGLHASTIVATVTMLSKLSLGIPVPVQTRVHLADPTVQMCDVALQVSALKGEKLRKLNRKLRACLNVPPSDTEPVTPPGSCPGHSHDIGMCLPALVPFDLPS